ncbi:MAG: hypothetical protein IT320_22705 [Anaerolineae bacterium]|nr:hypothetical protein [Anaerolineae bacterium]
MTPIVNGLEADMGNRISFRYLDALDGADGQRRFEDLLLPGHPAFVVFDREGQEVYRAFGIITAQTLRAALEAALN